MSVRPALAIGLCLSLCACATTAPVPYSPQIVQLALSGSSEPCDWSDHYEPDDAPGQWSLGASYWPHTQPRPGARRANATAPLTFYGTHTQFTTSETSPILCLRLFKRPSIAHTGLAPVAVIEIRPEGDTAHISALRLDPKLTHLDLGFVQKGTAQALNATLLGNQLVLRRPKQEADQPDLSSALQQTLHLDLGTGSAEGQMPILSSTASIQMAVIASHSGAREEAQNALNLLLLTPIKGASDAHFPNGQLAFSPR